MRARATSVWVVGFLAWAAIACDSGRGGSAPTASSAKELEVNPNAPCPARFSELPGADQPDDKSCFCDASALTGRVWGSGIYTLDSAPCAAALHAGAISPQGGRVTLRPAPGCAAYPASTNNKVATAAADRRDRSFYFPSVSDGKCPAPTP